MAVNFVNGNVAVGDPNAPYPNPSATSNIKDVLVKVVKLTAANFTVTTATNTMVAVLPAQATVLRMDLYIEIQLAGGSISAATMALGTASGGAQWMAANAAAYGTAGASTTLSPILNIMQHYNVPLGGDSQVWVAGLATTGTPTSGEMYLSIYYVN